jgi:malic enzyme
VCAVLHPARASNAYIFPAVGLAAVLARCRRITDDVFVVAAEEVAGMVGLEELAAGRWAAGRCCCRAQAKCHGWLPTRTVLPSRPSSSTTLANAASRQPPSKPPRLMLWHRRPPIQSPAPLLQAVPAIL